MKIIITATPTDAGVSAAAIIADLLNDNRSAVLGFATGSSPLPVYEALEKLNLDLTKVLGFALDEYVGLPDGDHRSYAAVISTEVVQRLGLRPDNVQLPQLGTAKDAGTAYETAIAKAGGIDLQILGIGSNGHLGFNEPGSSFDSRTRVVTLTDQTRADNARFFDSPGDVPRQAVSQGMATIFEARHLLLIAHGAEKAAAISRALHGPVTPRFPASMLQLHPSVTVVLDEAAATELKLASSSTHKVEVAEAE
jgi:glucosamine-6-phosphate deaminase